MSQSSPRVWLVTGCSSGFGRHFIEAILAHGDKAIATARKLDSIEDLVRKGAASMQLDVDATPSQLNAKIEEAIRIYGHVDVLLNNAGFGQLGTIEDIPNEMLMAQFQTNVFGPLNLARAVLPHFRKRNSGTLLVMSSVGWLVNAPGAGAYMASKAAVDSLFGTMDLELKNTSIRTLILQPGSFRTDLVAPDKVAATANASEPYKDFMTEFLQQMNEAHGKQTGDPGKLAKMVVDMVSTEAYDGKPLPTKVVLGSDAVGIATAIQKENLKNLEEWSSVAKWTDAEKKSGRREKCAVVEPEI